MFFGKIILICLWLYIWGNSSACFGEPHGDGVYWARAGTPGWRLKIVKNLPLFSLIDC